MKFALWPCEGIGTGDVDDLIYQDNWLASDR